MFYKPESDTFTVSYVNDGYPDADLKSIVGKDAFVEWLQKQSDYSFSGASHDPDALPAESHPFSVNNQRITKAMLKAFVE